MATYPRRPIVSTPPDPTWLVTLRVLIALVAGIGVLAFGLSRGDSVNAAAIGFVPVVTVSAATPPPTSGPAANPTATTAPKATAIPTTAPPAPPTNPPVITQNGTIGDGLHLPAMGWNHYNRFGNEVNDALIRQVIDAMVVNGMRDAGYRFINIDDSWESDHRNADGTIAVNGNFPNGIKPLADYAHSKGFKFGIYTTPADRTCNSAYHIGSPGQNNAIRDVQTFASWGVDYIKLDWCGADWGQTRNIVKWWHDAIVQTGRPIVLSINGGANPWQWAGADGTVNSWRTGADICQKWDEPATDGSHKCWGAGGGIINIVNNSHMQESAPGVGPGHVGDPDMLEVGNDNLSFEEQKSHFSLWAMVAAPLIAGNDPRSMDAATKSIFENQDIIAIDQDPAVHEATKVKDQGGFQYWVKNLADGGHAVLILNTNGTSAGTGIQWGDLGINGGAQATRDLWAHQSLGAIAGWNGQIPAHGVMVFRVGGPGA